MESEEYNYLSKWIRRSNQKHKEDLKELNKRIKKLEKFSKDYLSLVSCRYVFGNRELTIYSTIIELMKQVEELRKTGESRNG